MNENILTHEINPVDFDLVEEKSIERLLLDIELSTAHISPTETTSSEEISDITPEAIQNIPTETKKNIFDYLSGFHLDEKIKKKTKRTTTALLAGGAFLFATFAMKNTPIFENVSNHLAQKQDHATLPEKYLDKVDFETLNSIPERAREIYYEYLKYDQAYIIADKAHAELILINADNTLIAKIPALFGKDKSDQENLAGEENDWQLQPTSPAGRYYMGFYNITEADKSRYGGDGMRIYMKGNDIGLHPIYPGEYTRRKQSIDSKTIEDNHITGGCINVATYEKHIRPYFHESSEIFILPYDEAKTIDLTGKVIIFNQ